MQEQRSWEDRLPRLGLGIDLAMLTLVIINLTWIVLDSLFAFEGVQRLLTTLIGADAVSWYDANIHDWFFLYDLVFVGIFIAELLARWLYAVWHRSYSHWLVYPILHWYDVLGCIPIGELRWLRILRIIAVLVRLQKMGVIDYTQWSVYQLFARWFNIGIEELSDRIAVKILEGVQIEVASGEGLDRKIVERVVLPRKELLVDVISQRLAGLIGEVYQGSREDLEAYIKTAVSQAMHRNLEIRSIEAIPMLGMAVGKIVHHTVNDVVCRSLNNAVDGMQQPEFRALVADITDAVLRNIQRSDPGENTELNAAIIDLIEVIKDEVRVQRWKNPEQLAAVQTALQQG